MGFWLVFWADVRSFHNSRAKKASDTYKALAAFASGYLVSKTEPFIAAGTDAIHIQASFTGLMFFTSSFLAMFVLVVINRLYVEIPMMRSFSHADELIVSNGITEKIPGKDQGVGCAELNEAHRSRRIKAIFPSPTNAQIKMGHQNGVCR